jgi:phenylacetic acid degradation protein
MPVYAYAGLRPVVHETAFVHPDAVLIGDVLVGEGAFVAPFASLRGDMGRLIVGRGANVQDCCVMHGFPGKDCEIEEDGHVGHGAILHGCRIGRNALVGMNAVVMDGAVVGEDAFVGAMAFVKAGFEVPPRTLAAGMPARIVRELRAQEVEWKRNGTREYQELARRYGSAGFGPCEPLREPEPDRPRAPALTGIRPLFETKGGG